MPRRKRCVLPEFPCHITQRGVDRREVFSVDQDRITYLRLLQENLSDAAVRVLGYCLMSNHAFMGDTRNITTHGPGAPDTCGKTASSLACSVPRICGRLCHMWSAIRCERESSSMPLTIPGRARQRI